MNFNIYLNKNIGRKITRTAKLLHRSKSSIISEALEEWLEKQSRSNWPKGFFDFDIDPNVVPDFKNLRKDLTNNISEDPLS